MSTEPESNGPAAGSVGLLRRPAGVSRRAAVWLALGAVALVLAALLSPLLPRGGRPATLALLPSRPEAAEPVADGAALKSG
ncbi:MAG TPA: hypothetical protein VNK05_19410, partial [Chloroflexota bacterium]|nr:hypothetical protein [Chloroflexota bacterium]